MSSTHSGNPNETQETAPPMPTKPQNSAPGAIPTHNDTGPAPQPRTPIAAEFNSWHMQQAQVDRASVIRQGFSNLQSDIESSIAPGNGRYMAMVKTKLEEACMFAVKGIAKPVH